MFSGCRWEALALNESGVARVNAALAGIDIITTLAFRREIDLESEGPECLRLRPSEMAGLIQAMACCADLIRLEVSGRTPHGCAPAADTPSAKHLGQFIADFCAANKGRGFEQ